MAHGVLRGFLLRFALLLLSYVKFNSVRFCFGKKAYMSCENRFVSQK